MLLQAKPNLNCTRPGHTHTRACSPLHNHCRRELPWQQKKPKKQQNGKRLDVIKAKWRNREEQDRQTDRPGRQTDRPGRQTDKGFPTAPISNLNACVISSRGFIKWEWRQYVAVIPSPCQARPYSSRHHAEVNKKLRQIDGLQVFWDIKKRGNRWVFSALRFPSFFFF